MDASEREDLRRRIEAFEFDEPGTALTFARRLARENRWTVAHAHRVICEYRRFLFLAMTAGHPVTPSDAVDQAWHLHLTYTRSYWNRLCRDVLRRPLHHDPTRGGATESAKFEHWYERTRDSYTNAFGEAPPAEIWPAAEVRFGTDLGHVRVNAATHWLIPKRFPGFVGWRRGPSLALLAVAGASATGCGMLYETFPFSLAAGSFLGFFAVLVLGVFLAAGFLRWFLRGGGSPRSLSAEEPVPDPYRVAFLAGGQARAVQSALVALVSARAARTGATEGSFVLGSSALPPAAHPFERSVHACLERTGGQTVRDLAKATRSAGEVLRSELEARGWWLCGPRARRATWLPLGAALTMPALAAVRTWQGLSTDHDSGFIAGGAVVTFALAMILFARHAGRSRAGTATLAALRQRNRALRSAKARTGFAPAGAEALMLPLAVGLFGSSALAGSELDHLRRGLRPADAASSGCGTSSGCSGGDGGGGDGGGCGGGGCGGCGGGGD